jgi:hypothetical protein
VKKITIIVIICATACLFSSCNPSSYINWNGQSKAIAIDVIADLMDGDNEEIKQRFCEIVLNSGTDLDEQIITARNFLYSVKPEIGNILVGGVDGIEGGKYIFIQSSTSIPFTDSKTGEEYKILIYSYLICVDNPSKEGISLITIRRESDGKEVSIGEMVY